MIKTSITLQEVVDLLNDLLGIDPLSINALFNIRVYCNQRLADHPTVQVGCQGPKGPFMVCAVGFVGILNGLFGLNESGLGRLAMELDNGTIKRFKLLPEDRGNGE